MFKEATRDIMVTDRTIKKLKIIMNLVFREDIKSSFPLKQDYNTALRNFKVLYFPSLTNQKLNLIKLNLSKLNLLQNFGQQGLFYKVKRAAFDVLVGFLGENAGCNTESAFCLYIVHVAVEILYIKLSC